MTGETATEWKAVEQRVPITGLLDFNNLLTVVLGNLGFVEKMRSSASNAKLQQLLAHMRLVDGI